MAGRFGVRRATEGECASLAPITPDMTSYHHYPSMQASPLEFRSMQPYRGRASNFWYSLAWALVSVLAVVGLAFSLYRNGVLLKFARDWGVEQQYLSFERSVLGGPYWGAPPFELPMPTVAELATSQLATSISMPVSSRMISAESASAAGSSISPASKVESAPSQPEMQEHGTSPKHESQIARDSNEEHTTKANAEVSVRSVAKASKGESARVASAPPATRQKESTPSKLSTESTGTKRAAVTESSFTPKPPAPVAAAPVAAAPVAAAPTPAVASKPAPAKKANPLDAAIRAAVGK